MPVDLERLTDLRKRQGLSLAELGRRIGLSGPQVQRLETGQRRLSVDVLERYAKAVGTDLISFIQGDVKVPVIGIIDAGSEVRPLPPEIPPEVVAPRIVADPENLAALRWATTGRFSLMGNHYMFFYRNRDGVPDDAWGQRSVMGLSNGRQRIGWPMKTEGQVHIADVIQGTTEFHVKIAWASPILAVVSDSILPDAK